MGFRGAVTGSDINHVATRPQTPEMSMLRTSRLPVLGLAAVTLAATAGPLRGQTSVASPDGRNQVTVEVREGRLTYGLSRDGRVLILPSLLGFEFRGAPPLRDGLRVTDSTRQSHDEWWTQPWGEVARVRDHHNELAVSVIRRIAESDADAFSPVFVHGGCGLGKTHLVQALGNELAEKHPAVRWVWP